MFRRRNPLSWAQWAKEQVYPRGGFKRATTYLWHRLRRLPDPPHRIARGVFAGTFVNFPPILGVQVLSALGLAWVMRGNLLAAALATLLSNPVTTPVIAVVSLKMGYWMLGVEADFTLHTVFAAFSAAGHDLWQNFLAIFTKKEAHWDGLIEFWNNIYLPYLVGSIIPGLITSSVLYKLTIPALTAYQALRHRALLKRVAARREAAERDRSK
ncbi:DUF2062 domain-containing protein [Stagnihabitans tardus]|uniref:DUF2062 domain-containing protein n=1 Tax=Stagnihabitans tardus TaxID=2699202 RepID=A0AAE4YAL6_9RHOB|nr:DUF2062 domain-containing protein [Stagnihabitans tardus]NBZ88157.1 DUF2062 domain-containing protein [Stagnihabitans tardus]